MVARQLRDTANKKTNKTMKMNDVK